LTAWPARIASPTHLTADREETHGVLRRESLEKSGDCVPQGVDRLTGAHRVPVVDEERDLHRVGAVPGGNDPRVPAALLHDELVLRQIRNRLTGQVHHMHVGDPQLLRGRRRAGEPDGDARDQHGASPAPAKLSNHDSTPSSIAAAIKEQTRRRA
jgi:hypothetical protein